MNDNANSPIDALDVEILGQLAELFDVIDPAPTGLADESVFALSMVALDAELAILQDTSELSVRADGATSTDTVTFSSSSLQLMVSSTMDDDGLLRIDGWVTGGGIEVELLEGSSSTAATSDVHGRLVWLRVPRGPIRFLLHPPAADAKPILTPVVEL